MKVKLQRETLLLWVLNNLPHMKVNKENPGRLLFPLYSSSPIKVVNFKDVLNVCIGLAN